MCTELLHAVAINPPNMLQPSLHCKNDYPFANIELGWPLSRQQYRITGYFQQKAAHCRGAGRIFVHIFSMVLHMRWQASGEGKQQLFMADNVPGHAWQIWHKD